MAIFNSGTDWITLTNSVAGNPWDHLLSALWDYNHLTSEEWSGNGYDGLRCGETGLRYGVRSGKEGGMEEILIASGAFSEVLIAAPLDWLDFNCTRIDFQVTVYLEKPDKIMASGLYERILGSRVGGDSMVGRRKTSLVRSDTGETLYVGSRKSGRKFFRLYDKSSDYDTDLGWVWRQEVQYGRKCAKEALWRYVREPIATRREFLVDLVCSEFVSAMSFTLLPATREDIQLVASVQDVGGIQARLKWLERCVKPVMTKLSGLGYERESLVSIGLEEQGET